MLISKPSGKGGTEFGAVSAETRPSDGAGCVVGRTLEGIPGHEETLAVRERELGPDHPDTLASRNTLALAYLAAGRTAEAIRCWRRP